MTAPLPTDPVELARIAYLGLDPERVPRSRAKDHDMSRCRFATPSGRCRAPVAWVQVKRRVDDDCAGRPVHQHYSLCADHAAQAKATPGGRESYWQEVGP